MTIRRATNAQEMASSFGYKAVRQNEKQSLVNDVFDGVADRYDLMNDLMSGGMHRIWKQSMVNSLMLPRNGTSSWRCLDVAGGTGDIAMLAVEKSDKKISVAVLDINNAMLNIGMKRVKQKNLDKNISFVEGNGEHLPFSNNTFNAYTIAFGIRNITRIDRALKEAYRVLKYGGRFLCLEFSRVEVPVLDALYEFWSKNAIPRIGHIVTGNSLPYQYLIESICKFPDQEKFATMIKKAGFSNVKWCNYSGGITALHSGWKI